MRATETAPVPVATPRPTPAPQASAPTGTAASSAGPAPVRMAASPPPAPPRPAPAPAAQARACPCGGFDSDLRAKAVALLRDAGNDFIASTLQHTSVEESGDAVVVRATAEDRTTLEFDWQSAEQALQKAAGRKVRVTLGPNLAETERVENVPEESAEDGSPVADQTTQRALEDPDVQTFQQLFPGQVREVRNLREFS
ncbi:MAG: hypothetical protein R2724_28675 [Bryobacterales bacterium]